MRIKKNSIFNILLFRETLSEKNGHVVQLDSGKCFYIEIGDNNNPPVILIHGFTNTSIIFEPIIPYIVLFII